jgi:glyoxylase-like metal-dependent hydrolase (beta-lactamase superfamily II)
MRTPTKRGVVLGAILVLGTASTAVRGLYGALPQESRPAPSASAIEVDKIKDNLYVLKGGGGNTAAFITASGVVLVDTKLVGWGQPILDKLKEITDKPVSTVINTHTHFDHVGGNPDLPPTVEVVAHENTAALMKEMRPVTGGPKQPDVFKGGTGPGLPKRTFKDRLTLGKGTERIELRYFGRAHTGGDAWVIFPAQRAMHSGDAFGSRVIPIIDANNGGSGVEYPRTIAKAAALTDIDVVITGHTVTTLTMAELKTYGEFVNEFVQTVQAVKKAGKTIDDVVNSWTVSERYLKSGYMTPEEYEKVARQPISTRVRANAEVIWSESK